MLESAKRLRKINTMLISTKGKNILLIKFFICWVPCKRLKGTHLKHKHAYSKLPRHDSLVLETREWCLGQMNVPLWVLVFCSGYVFFVDFGYSLTHLFVYFLILIKTGPNSVVQQVSNQCQSFCLTHSSARIVDMSFCTWLHLGEMCVCFSFS